MDSLFSQFSAGIVAAMDYALGWMLDWPRDATLLVLAVGTGAFLVAIRRFTSDQDLLRRCRQDKRILNQRIRQAKANKQPEAMRRLHSLKAKIAPKAFRCEMLPLVASLLPLAALGIWGFERLEFHPLRDGEVFNLAVTFPESQVGQLAHLVPQEGMECENGWVQKIESRKLGGQSEGKALWKVRAKAREIPYQIEIRQKEQTCTSAVRVGRTYLPPAPSNDKNADAKIEVGLEPVRLFGFVPGISFLALPPWLVGYLVIAIPSVLVMKRVFRVC